MRGNTARGLTSGRHADRQATAMVVAVGGVEKTFVVSEGCLQKYCVGPIGIVALVGACCRQKQSVVFLANITCIAWKVVYYGRRDVTWSACVLDCRACRCALQKRMNRSRCLLGGGRLANGPNESCIVGLHIGTIWQIRWNDRCVAAMRAVATLERFIFKNITLY